MDKAKNLSKEQKAYGNLDDSLMAKSALLFTPHSFHPENLTASLSVRTIFISGTDSCLCSALSERLGRSALSLTDPCHGWIWQCKYHGWIKGLWFLHDKEDPCWEGRQSWILAVAERSGHCPWTRFLFCVLPALMSEWPVMTYWVLRWKKKERHFPHPYWPLWYI